MFEITIIDKIVIFVLAILTLATDGSGTLYEGGGGYWSRAVMWCGRRSHHSWLAVSSFDDGGSQSSTSTMAGCG